MTNIRGLIIFSDYKRHRKEIDKYKVARMIKTIYHGSDHIIEKPTYHGGRRHNDYGYGFYTTEDKNLACEWAAGPDRDGFVNSYELDFDGLKIINLESSLYNALNWLEILLENRTFSFRSPLAAEAAHYLRANFAIDYEDADIIIGYRADDSYFTFAQEFLNGTISYEQLSRALRLGQLGEQIVIKSQWATDVLKYTGNEPVSGQVWYPKREAREKKARKEYFDPDKNRFRKDDLYIIKIIDEEVKPGDSRL